MPFLIERIGKDIKGAKQLAFIVNLDTFNIFISRSGHPTLLRDRDKRDYHGGWVFINQSKITFNSGSLGHIPPKWKEALCNSLSNYLNKSLRIIE